MVYLFDDMSDDEDFEGGDVEQDDDDGDNDGDY